MKKLAFSLLLISGISSVGFSQNIALNNLTTKEDNWKGLTPLLEVNDILRYIYSDPLKENYIHTIPAGYPLDKDIHINSFYGSRNHPVHNVTKFHRGIDLKGDVGEKVYATGDGQVIEAGYKSDIGNYVKIKHSYGFESIYGHLSKISVKKGQNITRHQLIGKVGATGTVTGPHLHYTLKKNNSYIDPFDFLFLDFESEGVSMLWAQKGKLA
ncbi:M23 family metallopeptidase [Emticicia sp. 17c]|uniref:M23 family metallopeptidase n=1 Tax=Emticicia sp. 17c TaxID=3127704 RepID=UPI00301E0A6A